MVQVFQSFFYTLFAVGIILSIPIFFDDKLIALEDKFDAWFFRVFHIKLPFGKSK